MPRIPRAAPETQPAVQAAKRLNRGSAMLAASVLADSAMEHYRGGFYNPAMVTPILTSIAALSTSLHGHNDDRQRRHRPRDRLFGLTAATGIAGIGFHLYNTLKKPGGFSWQNLFYSGPLGAPAAILLSGLFGLLAERVRDTPPGQTPRIFGLNAGRVTSFVTSIGLFATSGEAGLLHFRGAFQNPAMFLPVTLPPVAGALMGKATFGNSRKERRFTRFWLRLTALLGIAGSGFHIYGVSRAMGGWRNWRQNMVDGPPIPAPPSFTGLAMAGLAALALLRAHPED